MADFGDLPEANWSDFAQWYDQTFSELKIYEHTYRQFCEAVNNENARILEIGCGPATVTAYLLKNHPDYRILACDPAEGMLDIARNRLPEVQFENFACQDLHQIQPFFDAILSGFVIHYISDQDLEQLFTDCQRLLKKDGILYLSDVEGLPEDSGRIPNSSQTAALSVWYRTETELLALAQKNGFSRMFVNRIPYTKANGKTEIHRIQIWKKSITGN